MEPTAYHRRVLLAVTGLSPQVVTETLFALSVEHDPAFIPTEIHLLTTTEGAERARLSLLTPEPGWFQRLIRDYGLPPIEFGLEHIHILHDDTGRQLDDIRSLADNAIAADAVTEHVRNLTADPDSALHVSIAGGRKTMSYLPGLC